MRETEFVNINIRAKALMEQTASSANQRLQQQVDILRVRELKIYFHDVGALWCSGSCRDAK